MPSARAATPKPPASWRTIVRRGGAAPGVPGIEGSVSTRGAIVPGASRGPSTFGGRAGAEEGRNVLAPSATRGPVVIVWAASLATEHARSASTKARIEAWRFVRSRWSAPLTAAVRSAGRSGAASARGLGSS